MSVSTNGSMTEITTVTSHCTSEQMDLWRQVFAEAARQVTKNSTTNPLR